MAVTMCTWVFSGRCVHVAVMGTARAKFCQKSKTVGISQSLSCLICIDLFYLFFSGNGRTERYDIRKKKGNKSDDRQRSNEWESPGTGGDVWMDGTDWTGGNVRLDGTDWTGGDVRMDGTDWTGGDVRQDETD